MNIKHSVTDCTLAAKMWQLRHSAILAAVCLTSVFVGAQALAQTQAVVQSQFQTPAQSNTQTVPDQLGKSSSSKAIEAGPRWQSLTMSEQVALQPLQTDWASLDASRKKKWLAVAKRFQTMLPTDQARMHQRMKQWAQLTPAQRSVARDNYSAVLSSPSSSGDAAGKSNLNEQWAKYQALSPEKKALLAQQASKSPADQERSKPLSQ
jgi:xanthosine utilization system XapX-like protein